jgi:ABC-type transport system involved in multi-copper enzyme maturation permease subunit
MFASIVRFEIACHLKNPLLYITAGLLFLMCFGATVSDSVTIGGAIGNVHRNAPIVIINFLAVMSAIGLFIVTAFVASSIHRDFERGTHELFFSRPVPKLDYLLGRFVGSMLVSLLVFLGPAAGILVGSLMPWLEPERIGPFMPGAYVFALLVIVVPNVLFMGATFFTVAGLTRSMMATYLGVIITFVAYGISRYFAADLESELVASLTDPFAMAPLGVATKYWTIVEQNGSLPSLAGPLLANRILWVTVGVLILAVGCWRFSYSRATSGRRGTPRRESRDVATIGVVTPVTPAAPVAATRTFGGATSLSMLAHQTRLETVSVLRSIPFVVMLVFAVFNLIASMSVSERIAGTSVLPVTHLMLNQLSGSYLFMIMIVVTFYAGELLWKERAIGVHEVVDSLPVPSWVLALSKLVALLAVVAGFTAVGAVATMGYQLFRGYTRLEPELYVKGLLVAGVSFVFIAVLAATVQVLSRTKFLGFLVMILFLLSFDVMDALDLQHNLYRYGQWPSAPYSDMNGFGHFVAPMFWFGLYWSCLAVAMVGAVVVLWRRGTETGLAFRLRRVRVAGAGAAGWVVVAGLVCFVATGAFIYYNTNVLNEYLPDDRAEARRAEYEHRFRRYKDIAQPRVADVAADVDIYPDQRRVEIRGRYVMVNRSGEPIPELHLNLNPAVTVNSLSLPAHRVREAAPKLGYSIYTLDRPLPPGESMELGFDLTVANRGFVNNAAMNTVVTNGTFFNNREFFPLLGYLEERQLVDRNARREHDLPPVRRMAAVDDEFARRNTYLTVDSDWVHFATTVSTSADQVALAPGYLEEEWQDGGRRYFRYEMDAPILHFFAYLSADYTVRRDRWNDVEIAVYYHRPHDSNVERMIDSVKSTLEYCTANFSPYQHRQVRIVEFPRYAQFAQSFPNTIPFSESVGFIADIDDGEDIDTVFYVTAHEVAHQWWAHQVIGGNVQGATMLSEALAQYTALMVMEHRYGRDTMRRFLKYELDEYLRGRGGELVEEMPLLLVENQDYVHYNKGSVVMYAVRDSLGEDTVNQALARYIDQVAFQPPPYTNSLELLEVLREVAPGAHAAALFDDMLANITLYSNRVQEAVYTELDGNRFRVDLTVAARKVRCDGQGRESEVPMDDWVDVGVFGERTAEGGSEGEVLHLAKVHLTEPVTTLQLVVEGRPVRAGVDPYNKLIDRISDDNTRRVKRVSSVPGSDSGATGGMALHP